MKEWVNVGLGSRCLLKEWVNVGLGSRNERVGKKVLGGRKWAGSYWFFQFYL